MLLQDARRQQGGFTAVRPAMPENLSKASQRLAPRLRVVRQAVEIALHQGRQTVQHEQPELPIGLHSLVDGLIQNWTLVAVQLAA